MILSIFSFPTISLSVDAARDISTIIALLICLLLIRRWIQKDRLQVLLKHHYLETPPESWDSSITMYFENKIIIKVYGSLDQCEKKIEEICRLKRISHNYLMNNAKFR